MINYRQKLLSLYDLFPFHAHPLWIAIQRKELSYQQVIQAEVQHWIRTSSSRTLRRGALDIAEKISPRIFEMLLQTYLEECTHDDSGPSHLELIERLVKMGGATPEYLEKAEATPGNSAAIALYKDISARGAGCHMLGAGAVEFYYSQLSPKIYEAYTNGYGMTDEQAETYRIHGPMDREHAERAFSILDEAISLHGWRTVESSVRDAFVATSLHYDGMLQAAVGKAIYWDGAQS
ncbi:iron-containing redox enzyme family protein [Azospirillum rugosum]|uniref:Pyrroloquinoline quinone (PQQ) biosynthesis protein C n=1 Tax=Azospirillum rugosum TaxID=416170 RepID=A0ABS4SJD2_9PROT|nr:iron-containing redox enzyme family protein [Azospirillum rugosum]MBP2292671.1 pyrroloquinoline quinone (PQQ) biosynthesis protein C [Azospirillum rugosum]MDQ0526305.1 pyrroloquinoline quinone (PQQ) biosynthesis protein C [Azospirillum rugosum]